MLATGSGDTCTKFWGRARPGDPWRDREQREQEENAATEGQFLLDAWVYNKLCWWRLLRIACIHSMFT